MRVLPLRDEDAAYAYAAEDGAKDGEAEGQSRQIGLALRFAVALTRTMTRLSRAAFAFHISGVHWTHLLLKLQRKKERRGGVKGGRGADRRKRNGGSCGRRKRVLVIIPRCAGCRNAGHWMRMAQPHAVRSYKQQDDRQ